METDVSFRWTLAVYSFPLGNCIVCHPSTHFQASFRAEGPEKPLFEWPSVSPNIRLRSDLKKSQQIPASVFMLTFNSLSVWMSPSPSASIIRKRYSDSLSETYPDIQFVWEGFLLNVCVTFNFVTFSTASLNSARLSSFLLNTFYLWIISPVQILLLTWNSRSST